MPRRWTPVSCSPDRSWQLARFSFETSRRDLCVLSHSFSFSNAVINVLQWIVCSETLLTQWRLRFYSPSCRNGDECIQDLNNSACHGSVIRSLVYIQYREIQKRCCSILRAAPLNFLRLNHPTCVSYGAPSDEDLRWGTSGAHKKHMHIRLTFVTELCLFFFCLLVQPDGLLFCLKRDKPRCFPSSTLSTAGFPGLGDLSLHSCTCFLCFVSLPCSLVCLSHYISLFLCPHLFFLSVFSFPVSLWQPARQSFPLFCNLSDRWY